MDGMLWGSCPEEQELELGPEVQTGWKWIRGGEGILGVRLGKAKAPRLGDKGPLRSSSGQGWSVSARAWSQKGRHLRGHSGGSPQFPAF